MVTMYQCTVKQIHRIFDTIYEDGMCFSCKAVKPLHKEGCDAYAALMLAPRFNKAMSLLEKLKRGEMVQWNKMRT